jgi:hypothetical protein
MLHVSYIGRWKSRRMLRPWSGDSTNAAPICQDLESPVLGVIIDHEAAKSVFMGSALHADHH